MRTVLCLLLFLAPAVARATVTSALINKQLDTIQPLKIDATLPEAIRQIGDQTAVRIEVDPAVWELLPWGEQTTLTAKVENQTLRQGLTAICREMALQFELTDQAVELQPVPALRRLGRRATVQELTVLDQMYSQPLDLPGDRVTVRDLLSAVGGKISALSPPFSIDNRSADATAGVTVSVPKNSSVADGLEALSRQVNATWYPWGKTIVVVTKQEQVRTQLGRTLSARYNAVDVSQVLLELFQRAGVNFTVEPGAYDKVPIANRSVQLTLDNATVQQGLESIGGYTGLGFEITEKGVHVYTAAEINATTRPARK